MTVPTLPEHILKYTTTRFGFHGRLLPSGGFRKRHAWSIKTGLKSTSVKQQPSGHLKTQTSGTMPMGLNTQQLNEHLLLSFAVPAASGTSGGWPGCRGFENYSNAGNEYCAAGFSFIAL